MSEILGYHGKVGVVTGAASGMGKALAELLVQLGAEVHAIDRVEPDVEGIASATIANLGDRASIDAAFAGLPDSIDAFFGVAGVSGVHQSFLDTVTINFIANKYITDTYLKDRVSEGGSLSFVTSNAGLRWETPAIREELAPLVEPSGWEALVQAATAFDERHGGVPGSLGYILSKRALNYWVATEVGPLAELRRIRINAILPAMTVSGMLPEFAEMKGGMDAVESDLGPAGRLAESAEMARVLAFLGSDLAGYVSGTHLSVDFGMNAQQIAGIAPDRLSWTFDSVLNRAPAA
ncbi:MAG: SDR family oxidoreductase [Microbacterium sp.]